MGKNTQRDTSIYSAVRDRHEHRTFLSENHPAGQQIDTEYHHRTHCGEIEEFRVKQNTVASSSHRNGRNNVSRQFTEPATARFYSKKHDFSCLNAKEKKKKEKTRKPTRNTTLARHSDSV